MEKLELEISQLDIDFYKKAFDAGRVQKWEQSNPNKTYPFTPILSALSRVLGTHAILVYEDHAKCTSSFMLYFFPEELIAWQQQFLASADNPDNEGDWGELKPITCQLDVRSWGILNK